MKQQIPDAERISATDAGYPQKMKEIFDDLMPPDIWFIGNADLLSAPGVGFCGSRNASQEGLNVAADCARQLSEHRLTVISGYAAGVDMASHEAALSSGGSTVIILPEGIDQFRVKKTIKDVWDWDRVVVISYFARDAIWRPDRAMERNRAIVGLSDAVIVLEARDKGGTLNAGYRALATKKPLFVAFFGNMTDGREGNRQLLDRGGIKLQRSVTTGKAKLTSLFSIFDELQRKK